MTINDGKGIFDQYGLLDSCIKDLSRLRIPLEELAAIGNPIISVINRLIALKGGLMKEEEERNKENGHDHPAEREDIPGGLGGGIGADGAV